MKAVSYSEKGGPEVLKYTEDHVLPELNAKKDVLVRVLATSVNPVDWKLRLIGVKLPKIPGCDFVGTVEKVFESGSNKKCVFSKGEKVYGMIPNLNAMGTCAEFVSISQQHLSLAPKLPIAECAAIPLVGLTVMQAFKKMGIKKGNEKVVKNKSILIHAGAGGVGSLAIQLAKAFQLNIFTTCSKKNFEFCTSLGADVCIDYNTTKFESVCSDLDFVLDTMGGDYELRSVKIIKSNGHFVNIMNSGWATKWGSNLENPDGVTSVDSTIGSILGFTYAAYRYLVSPVIGPWYNLHIVSPNGQDLSDLVEYYDSGKIKVHIDKTFVGLEKVKDAHEYLQTGHVRGKVVVVVGEDQAKL